MLPSNPSVTCARKWDVSALSGAGGGGGEEGGGRRGKKKGFRAEFGVVNDQAY